MKCDFCNDGECCGEIGRLKEERDALRAEVEAHVKLNEPSKVTKYMAEAIRLEKERDALRAALEEALETIQHYSCAGCQPEAKGVYCYQYRSCKDYARLRRQIKDL